MDPLRRILRLLRQGVRALGRGIRRLREETMRRGPPIVSVIRLTGVIGQVGRFRGGLNMSDLAGPLERAFSFRPQKAVAVIVNSPGGSPVQAGLIARRIRALADEKEVPVLVFAEDVAASGGYMLALAGDEIFAHENSIVGSIGVVSPGFGFTGLMDKLGIERRLHASGARKGMLDPFRPEDPKDVSRLRTLQTEIHQSFKDFVRERRGDRLKGTDRQLFDGNIWTGQQAIGLGLIDGLGDVRAIMRERFGEKVRFRRVGLERGWLRRRLGIAGLDASRAAPRSWADDLLVALETRAEWERFGL